MKKILILISQGIEILEVSPFIDIFGWNMVVGKKNTIVTTASIHDIIYCTWNLKIFPQLNLKKENIDLKEYDALIIPGGFGKAKFFDDMKDSTFKNVVQHFNEKNKVIIGICTGVIPLGEAGVLKGRKATTYLLDNGRYFSQLEKYGAIPIKKEIVEDGNLITCSGPKNALETAFLLLEKFSDKENCNIVKKNMCF